MADESPGLVKTLSSHQDDLIEMEKVVGKNCLSPTTDGLGGGIKRTRMDCG